MAETTCLSQSFSYSGGIQHQEEVRNPLHELNQSVSFGRFATESLSWEKWSTFPHRKYVEEAEKFSRPGSVAQMKAFFDAHYKNVAAMKAAEAANKNQIMEEEANKIPMEEHETDNEFTGSLQTQSFADQPVTEEKLMEKPLLKKCESSRKEKSTTAAIAFASTTRLSLLCNQTPLPNKNCSDLTRRTPNSSRTSVNSAPVKDINRNCSSIILTVDGSRVPSISKIPLPCSTPMKPIQERKIQEFVTPQSAMNRENSTNFQSSVVGTKKPRPRWNLLATDCSKFLSSQRKRTLASPFTFRTEERAARRKEKLEGKFNSEGPKKLNIQPSLKGKAEAEFKKLCGKFCFKARPLPDFYKERPRKKL